MTLYHRLKLYEEDGSLSTKKPVVSEMYEEVIFSEPHEDFYNRVSNHVKGGPWASFLMLVVPKDMVPSRLCRPRDRYKKGTC